MHYAQNPLDTFPRSFPVDGEVANLLRGSYGETVALDHFTNHFGLYSALSAAAAVILPVPPSLTVNDSQNGSEGTTYNGAIQIYCYYY